jgi:hypothetical protein
LKNKFIVYRVKYSFIVSIFNPMREAKSGKLKDKGVLNIQILITSKLLSPSKYSVNFWLKLY